MPPLRHTQSIHAPNTYTSDLSYVAKLHGGKLLHRYARHQPYDVRTPPHAGGGTQSHKNFELPPSLLNKIKNTQEASVNKTTQKKDASRLQEFMSFCEGLGIKPNDALPAREDVLIAWASSYAGRLASKTVGAKLLAIRKEHERQGLIWFGRARLRRILQGVEELRPPSSFRSKRAPVTISMLEDLNRGLDRHSGLDICIRAIALLSFFCQLRSGEILPPTHELANILHLVHLFLHPHRHSHSSFPAFQYLLSSSPSSSSLSSRILFFPAFFSVVEVVSCWARAKQTQTM